VLELVIATFNVHAGVDGWGRPFDVVAACKQIDADVLFLQENWMPDEGESIASLVAAAGGYEVYEARLSDALLFQPADRPTRRWGPSKLEHRDARPLWVSDEESLALMRRRRPASRASLGGWGLAMLSRVTTRGVETIELGRLSRDYPRLRAALMAEVEVDGCPLSVVGTHLAHFVHGSPILLNALRQRLPARNRPGVLVGDMNFWGPPVALALPGWRRAVRTRTYPSWGAHSQIDHILVTRRLKVVSGGTLAVGRSDHLPLRARLAVA
jgi:endonuclease/exonuclease/phosphatase family metal-dependent hydrolase